MTDTADVMLRKAKVVDVPLIANIVNHHARQNLMLPRPISKIYDNIRDYTVVVRDGQVIGCGALHVVWDDLAEIRAVALVEDHMGKGYGRMLVGRLVDEARSLELAKVFVLTFREAFFARAGFAPIDKAELPHKIWGECVNCVHFPNCSEVAMIRYLDGCPENT